MKRYFVIVIDRNGRAHANAFGTLTEAQARTKEVGRVFGRRNVFLIEGGNDMCKMRRRNRRLNYAGIKVLKKHENSLTKIRVELTRKTDLAGRIIYGVVITNMYTGRYHRVMMFPGIAGAYDTFKAAVA